MRHRLPEPSLTFAKLVPETCSTGLCKLLAQIAKCRTYQHTYVSHLAFIQPIKLWQSGNNRVKANRRTNRPNCRKSKKRKEKEISEKEVKEMQGAKL